jgi:RNA polymerase sigma-70 factor (sigma-E family)
VAQVDRYEGFREFVAARGKALTRAAYLLTGDQHLAEDLLQNVLSRVVSRWDRLLVKGNPESYIRTSLYREYVSWLRRKRNSEIPTEVLPEAVTATDFADLSTLRLSLERALDKLTRQQRAVIVLRFYEDLSEADAARILGCSVGTIKSQTHRALARLRVVAPELSAIAADDEPHVAAAQTAPECAG